MRKGKNRSEVSIRSSKANLENQEICVPPLDTLTAKIISLRVNDEEPKLFAMKVTFFDQLVLSGVIKATGARVVDKQQTIAVGTTSYDPSDYERMCRMADCPLSVIIQPLKNVDSKLFESSSSLDVDQNEFDFIFKCAADVNCCNVDILQMLLGKDKMCVKKRMEPKLKRSVLHRKSWENLPLLTMELSVERNELNAAHHNVLKRANYMKLTVVGAYNMVIPFEDDFVYMAASKTPLHNEMNCGLVTFGQGHRIPKRFKTDCFYPKWESLRTEDCEFAEGDEKLVYNLDELQNEDDIDLKYYVKEFPPCYKTIWGSFHRTLILDNSDQWLWKHLCRYKWPLEVHIYGDNGGYSFMAFLNLFKFLYPGENRARLAVPLQWINSDLMYDKCGCDLMLTPNNRPPSVFATTQKPSKITTNSAPTSTSTDVAVIRPTGADENDAFVIVEIELARPLKKVVIPPYIHSSEIKEMLRNIEQGSIKRECTGRGQLNRDWEATVRSAASSLRKVPYYGMTEFCLFHRQLSETRTRVEISSSCWQDAAVYVNNNFVVQEYLEPEEKFEELLMMAHVCLMRTACDTLVGVDDWQTMNPTLRAARHARQMQDTSHAMSLYLQMVVQKPRDADCWRELAVCLKDVDSEWADVCINKSVVLNPRHPYTLLCRASMIFETDPIAAEPFFSALLGLHPFWSTAWTITSAYYVKRELYHMADQILKYDIKNKAERVTEITGVCRSWEHELGDWWDPTPLLPGMNEYYDAADLLLRMRCMALAEVCLAQALAEEGESAAYFHLLALCCRLRGQLDEALCHIQLGLDKFGEISYLRSLQAECYHAKNDCSAAMASFDKVGCCIEPYSVMLSLPGREAQQGRSMLVDLVRRQPSAYAWLALAEDWINRASIGEGGDAGVTEEQAAAKVCAAACAVQALKWDRRTGKAWALLAKIVRPSARRLHCIEMAHTCGYEWSEEKLESSSESKQSLCHHLGKVLKECRCKLCEYLKI